MLKKVTNVSRYCFTLTFFSKTTSYCSQLIFPELCFNVHICQYFNYKLFSLFPLPHNMIPYSFCTGKLACEGKVENKFDMKPHRENLMDYGKLCRERTNMSMVKPRKTEVTPFSVLFMKCSYWIDPFCCHTL